MINRTLERARATASALGGMALPWEGLAGALRRADVVISSTAAPHPVLSVERVREARADAHRPLLLIDIAMPRDVEPAVRFIRGVRLHNIDDLRDVAERNKEQRRGEIPRAKEIVNEEAQRFLDWHSSLTAIPTVKALRSQAERVRAQEVERALRRLSPLSEQDRETIDELSRRIVSKLLHEPTVRLKAPRRLNGALEQAVRELFGIESQQGHHG